MLAASPAPAEAGCAKADKKPTRITKAEGRAAVRCLINKVRRNHGRRRLDNDRRVARAAYRHTKYMEEHHCFSHQCPGEPSLGSRLRRADYIKSKHNRFGYGENIGAGTKRLGTPRRIVRAWMGSSSHRAMILSGSWDEFGVGFAKGTIQSRSGSGGIYTVDFGFTRG